MIYICTHKEVAYTLDYDHVVIDNNKSTLPEDYGHMRGVYWLWKNVDLPNEVGVFQQRRYLDINYIPEGYSCVNSNAIMLNLPEYISVREQYNGCKDCHVLYMDIFDNIIGEDFANYVRNYSCMKMLIHDMFIMKRDDFNRYCEFIFSVLKKKDDIAGPAENRWLSERLTSYWFWKNFKQEEIFLANAITIPK